jgi:hypothetical protein
MYFSCTNARVSMFVAVSTATIALMTEPALGDVDCAADVNGDLSVDGADLLAVVTAWGPCSDECTADISPWSAGDGEVGADDLIAVVVGWGQCAAPPTSPPPDDKADEVLRGRVLWCEDFETANYDRWTGEYYIPSGCESNGFSLEKSRTGTRSHKSRVLCATADSHRGEGGLRFQGNNLVPHYAIPSTGGINAPHGVVVTLWNWVDAPGPFDATRWLSFLTVTDDCSNDWNGVVTLSLDDPSMLLRPAHVSSITYKPNAPAFELRRWNRITVYINYHSEEMHVWQNGRKVCMATFERAGTRMCQWHFGLYASGPNANITLYEDDYRIVRLKEPLTNFNREPRFRSMASACD